jgi:hypothetical protein
MKKPRYIARPTKDSRVVQLVGLFLTRSRCAADADAVAVVAVVVVAAVPTDCGY